MPKQPDNKNQSTRHHNRRSPELGQNHALTLNGRIMVLLLVIGFYLNRYYLPLMRPTMLNYVLYVLLQTIIIENAMPSGADFRVAGMYLKGILLYGFLLVALLVFM